MTNTPWAILLCRFKDNLFGDPNPKQFYVEEFSNPSIENIVTYWRDISYGELDLTGSQVFGFLGLDQDWADYKGSGSNDSGRQDLLEWAKKAAADAGIPLDGYYGVIVHMSEATDLWGSPHEVVCDSFSNLAQILQEIGHGYGLEHSRAVANPTLDYQHPFCIMSGLTFGGTNPTFQTKFGRSGPRLCSPYVFLSGWLSESRILRVATDGRSPASVVVTLADLAEQSPIHPQVAVLDFLTPQQVSYFVEYRCREGWDRGISGLNPVVISQLRPDGYAYFAGSIPGPKAPRGAQRTTRPYIDSQYDLAIRLLEISEHGRAVTIRIGPR